MSFQGKKVQYIHGNRYGVELRVIGGCVKILFVGDVYGRPGRRAAALLVPRLIEDCGVDFCIINGENAAGGFGLTEKIGKKFHAYGADVITTGNHVWDQKDSVRYIQSGAAGHSSCR